MACAIQADDVVVQMKSDAFDHPRDYHLKNASRDRDGESGIRVSGPLCFMDDVIAAIANHLDLVP